MITAPEPRANASLFGHDRGEAVLHTAATSGRLHHAWLLTGVEGIGKATLAFRFARAILTGFPGRGLEVPKSHPVFGQVAAGTHPDLVTVARGSTMRTLQGRGEIVVNDARDLLELLYLTPAAGGWRVIVIDGSEDLNKNAQNALLKVLEEPPRRAVFLLTTSKPNQLARTLRSRCLCLPLSSLDQDNMDRVLRHCFAGVGGEQLVPAIFDLAEGSPGRAVALLQISDASASNLEYRSSGPLPTLPEHQHDLVSKAQRMIHRRLVEAIGTGHSLAGEWNDAWIDDRYAAWSEIIALSAAAKRFSLDHQQLVLDISKAAHR